MFASFGNFCNSFFHLRRLILSFAGPSIIEFFIPPPNPMLYSTGCFADGSFKIAARADGSINWSVLHGSLPCCSKFLNEKVPVIITSRTRMTMFPFFIMIKFLFTFYKSLPCLCNYCSHWSDHGCCTKFISQLFFNCCLYFFYPCRIAFYYFIIDKSTLCKSVRGFFCCLANRNFLNFFNCNF